VLRANGTVTGWRDELFPVAASFYTAQQNPVFAMERAAVPFLGATEYGVHVSGLVVVADDNANEVPMMWMARRAADKSKWPGYLDHVAAGGQPVGISLTDNVIKECFEEAGIPEDLVRAGLRPAGVVSYERYAPQKDVVVRCIVLCSVL